MAWTVEISPEARKDLSRLGFAEAKRILTFLHERLSHREDPRSIGKALTGTVLSGLWRYRVGDYRLLCRIEDEKICIVVVDIGHRREVYRPDKN
jgi:mRNA interferase RelE/StbE